MGLTVGVNDRILVVAPHPDDESIGCGGLLCLYPGQCDVLLVTDGCRNTEDGRALGEIRVKEFRAATKKLGVCQTILLHIPEHEITKYSHDFIRVDFGQYKYVFVPNRYEEHEDHRAVCAIVRKLLKRQKSSAELLEYEVWTTIRYPNIKIDISDVAERKIAAIREYRSQVQELDYVGMILGLNAYRGKSRGCEYAEMFFSNAEKVQQRKKRLKKKIRTIFGLTR